MAPSILCKSRHCQRSRNIRIEDASRPPFVVKWYAIRRDAEFHLPEAGRSFVSARFLPALRERRLVTEYATATVTVRRAPFLRHDLSKLRKRDFTLDAPCLLVEASDSGEFFILP
jgi:hypothetical protein